MTISEVISNARFIVDANGQKTEVVLPVSTWNKLIAAWERLADMLEDEEDRTILRQWMEQRAVGKLTMISLEELEQELIADGLLPS